MQPGSRPARRAAAVTFAACLLAGACGDSEPSIAASFPVLDEGAGNEDDRAPVTVRDVAPGVDVVVDIGQYRHLQGTDELYVKLAFDATRPLTVTNVALDTDGFEPVEPTTKMSAVQPGQVVDIQFTLGRAHCDRTLDRAAVDAVVDFGSGPSAVSLPVPVGRLEDHRRAGCRAVELARQVEVTFGPVTSRTGAAVETSIRLERQAGTAPIELERASGSVILSVRAPAAEPIATLDPDAREVSAPVTVTASRCDPHGLSGSQRTFHFPIWLSVDGAASDHLELEPHPELRAAMEAAIDACIAAEASG